MTWRQESSKQIRPKLYLPIYVVMLMLILTPDWEHRDVSDSGSRECLSRPPRLHAGGRRLPAVPSSAGTTAIRNGVALAEIAETPGCWWAESARAWSLARTAFLANGRLLRRQLGPIDCRSASPAAQRSASSVPRSPRAPWRPWPLPPRTRRG